MMESSQRKACPECAEENHAWARFCRACGKALADEVTKTGLKTLLPAILVIASSLVVLVMSIVALGGAVAGAPGDIVDDVAGKPIVAFGVFFLPAATAWSFFARRANRQSHATRPPGLVIVAGVVRLVSLWLAA